MSNQQLPDTPIGPRKQHHQRQPLPIAVRILFGVVGAILAIPAIWISYICSMLHLNPPKAVLFGAGAMEVMGVTVLFMFFAPLLTIASQTLLFFAFRSKRAAIACCVLALPVGATIVIILFSMAGGAR